LQSRAPHLVKKMTSINLKKSRKL